MGLGLTTWQAVATIEYAFGNHHGTSQACHMDAIYSPNQRRKQINTDAIMCACMFEALTMYVMCMRMHMSATCII